MRQRYSHSQHLNATQHRRLVLEPGLRLAKEPKRICGLSSHESSANGIRTLRQQLNWLQNMQLDAAVELPVGIGVVGNQGAPLAIAFGPQAGDGNAMPR